MEDDKQPESTPDSEQAPESKEPKAADRQPEASAPRDSKDDAPSSEAARQDGADADSTPEAGAGKDAKAAKAEPPAQAPESSAEDTKAAKKDAKVEDAPAAKAAGKSDAPPKKAKPARPAKPRRPVKKGPTYEDVEGDEPIAALKERLGEALESAQSFLEQTILTVSPSALYDAMSFLREEQDYDYLIDLTALDYQGDEKRWCLVYQLYSYSTGRLLRVKSRLSEGEVPASVTPIWNVADWLEREVYDMFGIEFSGHPDLRRILLPDDWHGYPLRKDYDIKLQDQSWIQKHLKIRKVPN